MKFFLPLVFACSFFVSFSQSIVPFVLEDNCIFLYCKVNETDSVKFLFDTGANSSVINTNSNKFLPLKIDGQTVNEGSNGVNEVRTSSNNQITFSGVVKSKVTLSLIDFGTNAFDGVFGTDLMNKHIVEIDYNKGVLKFYEPAGFHANLESYDKVKIHFVDSYPSIPCSIVVKGKQYKGFFGLDSGANDALTIASPYERKHLLKNKTEQIALASFQGSDGSVYEMPIVLAPELKIGEKSFYAIPMNLSSATEGIDATEKMAGFFGNNFLKRFNTVLDLPNGFIYFKPNELLYSPF
ncbi:retropepsin-like aspartic protease [Fluviicola sp.]|uniref:retropepsin-like aspartic protease n=1 Tax=Fluviicola sp. TaxID=1917219 RepID=UPI00261CA0F7|nr:retropepsin-like aspartic protease [Fluviicola sp.]